MAGQPRWLLGGGDWCGENVDKDLAIRAIDFVNVFVEFLELLLGRRVWLRRLSLVQRPMRSLRSLRILLF
jgi:hypothetical protein